MKYEAYFVCDTCGHKWVTYYNRLKSLEQGDICENCVGRPSLNPDWEGAIAETHYYKELKDENPY